MQQEGEPSVEEILASIKNVIARDNRAATATPRRADATEEFIAQDTEEEAEDVLELGEAAEMVAEDDDGSALLGEDSQQSMRESLEALAMISAPGARPQIVRSGETSLEGMVREMLRPMLAKWLDENLPGMVEELVKAEIARIARKQS